MHTASQLSDLRGGWNGFGMAAGSFVGRGLMQSQREAQLPIICRFPLLKHLWNLSERKDLLELEQGMLESYATR